MFLSLQIEGPRETPLSIRRYQDRDALNVHSVAVGDQSEIGVPANTHQIWTRRRKEVTDVEAMSPLKLEESTVRVDIPDTPSNFLTEDVVTPSNHTEGYDHVTGTNLDGKTHR